MGRMKAKSKAAKRRTRMGRPVLPATDREPNGRKSRRIASTIRREDDMKAVVIEARQRIYGLSKRDADSQDGGSVVGRLYLAGRIKWHHRAALNRYAEDMARYYRLTGVQAPNPRGLDLNRVRGEPGDTDPARARDAANRMMALEGVLGAADRAGRPVTTIVKRVALEDRDDGLFLGHMVHDLVVGAGALARYYEIPAGIAHEDT